MITELSLFLHVVAAVGIVAAGIVQGMAGGRLRSAETHDQIRRWARFARSAGPLLFVSAALSLATGGHLAGAVWTSEARSGFSYPFVTLGAIGLVLLVPPPAYIGGRLLGALANASEETDLAVLQEDARSGRIWGPLHSLVGAGLALIMIMTMKPQDWFITGLILVLGSVLGWISGWYVASRSQS